MSGFFIGIDVGGTNLKAGLTDETGRLLAAARRPLDFRGAETFAADLADLAAEVLSTAGAVPGDAEGVGIGLPRAVSGGEVQGIGVFQQENFLLTKPQGFLPGAHCLHTVGGGSEVVGINLKTKVSGIGEKEPVREEGNVFLGDYMEPAGGGHNHFCLCDQFIEILRDVVAVHFGL